GNDASFPVALFIHGGPGLSDRDFVISNLAPLWCKKFIVASYDQRGTGGSYKGAKNSDINRSTLIEDAKCVIEYLCCKYGKQKIFIIGTSWGTEIGAYLCRDFPQLIAGYIACGQIVNGVDNANVSYQYAFDQAVKASDKKSLKKLLSIGRPLANGAYKNVFRGVATQMAIVTKYGGSTVKVGGVYSEIVKPTLQSKETTFVEKIRLGLGYIKGIKLLWVEAMNVDFANTCNKFSTPIFIFQGKYDMVTPSCLVKPWFDIVEAPDKKLVFFDKSAHAVMTEQLQEYTDMAFSVFAPYMDNAN
ncbi:MAG: alpha/beta hydrolase, partial [Clostridia bacterium]